MRILIAHEALSGAGGVESYLSCLVPGLLARGHAVGFLHHDHAADPGPVSLRFADVPTFGVADEGLPTAVERARAWRPDVCFSHNMRQLEVDQALVGAWPTVKMMHGYFGTCISGQKAHSFPSVTRCDRTLGPICLGLYLPRRCGQRRPAAMLAGYRWSSRQRDMFAAYSHIVVASDYMAREYTHNGVASGRVTVVPLFPTGATVNDPRPLPSAPRVLFAGRMTALKGGDVLVRAVAAAARVLERPIHLVMAGDGPEQVAWQDLARRVGVDTTFPGWVGSSAVAELMREASVVAVPSLWPEPFGLVGLEAAMHGVPAVGFDCGGIRQWLHHGVNGHLVREVGNHKALGAAIASAAGDALLNARLGEGARRVAAKLNIDAHLDLLETVLTRAAA